MNQSFTSSHQAALRQVAFVATLVCLVLSGFTRAEEKTADAPRSPRRVKLNIEEIEAATSSQHARQTIAASIPLDRLEDHHRAQVEALLTKRSLFRCLPALRIELEPSSYEFYRRQPEIAVAIWQVLGISEVELKQVVRDHYTVDSKDGSRGRIEILLRTDDLLIVRGTGNWHSGLLPVPIRSEGLFILRHRFEQDQDGRRFVTPQAALFLAFPQQSVRNVAKLISPVTNMIADRNFRDISLFLRMMQVASVQRPGWVERIAGRLKGLTRSQREELLKTAARAVVTARRVRETAAQR